MKIYTSYYDYRGKIYTPIAISRGVPKNYDGGFYTKLAPSFALENDYKRGGMSEEEYIAAYLDLLAGRGLTPEGVVNDLPFICTLMSWEKPYRFSHRHIVARWIEEGTGIVVEEFGSRFIKGGLGIKLPLRHQKQFSKGR